MCTSKPSAALAVWFLLFTVTGCKNLECGTGTIEVNNKCVAAAAPPGTECGPGTSFDAVSGRCVDDIFADGGGICGPNTTLITDEHGNRICVGTGGSGSDCSQPIPCPAPTVSGTVALCGRVFDLEDSTPLDDGNPDNGEPYKNVELRVYDPILFVTTPGTPPLMTATTDACGRFAINNAPRPSSTFIALATDDAPGQPDNLVQAGIAEPTVAGQVLDGLRAWTFRRATDAAWSTAAGLASGTTFGSAGVYIPIFLNNPPPAVAPFPGSPAPGVTVAFLDGGQRTPVPANDFYFDDTAPAQRHTVSATASVTGANGTALYINEPDLLNASGVGGAPQGSCWMTNLAAAPVGGAFVQERFANPESCP